MKCRAELKFVMPVVYLKAMNLRWFYLLLFFPISTFGQSKHCDVLIVNGRIVDGTGNSWYRGNVAITADKIVAVGNTNGYAAVRTIDARGKIIAPGFIDVHTHLEGDEKEEPEAKSFLYDGVTTCITGNCGASNTDLHQYFSMLDSLRMGVNVASLIGHNDVRKAVMGRARRDASPAELARMEAIVSQAMRDGAVGLSTGLIYIPGTYTPTSEIITLARAAAALGGVYASHMRDEGDKVTEAIDEAINIGVQANMPVQISHFKVSGQQNWGRSAQTLAMVADARRRGIDVTIDQYPYTASSTSISTLLPDEILADGQDSINARLQRPEVRKYVANYMRERLRKRKLKHLSYAVVAGYKYDSTYNGKSIEQINLLQGRKHDVMAEAETVMDMMMHGGAGAVFHGMGEEDVKRIMQYPFNMFASDASVRVFGRGMPHPRGYGTNARVLARYVREQNVLSLEEAVRRMTSLPAQKFALTGRGLLVPGYFADVVVFDPEVVQDMATYEKPHAYSKGFTWVLVNGKFAIENDTATHSRNGRVLYGPSKN